MAKPNVTWAVNTTANDGANSGGASGGTGGNSSNWLVLDPASDKLAFTDSQQENGDSVSGEIYAPMIPESGSAEAPKTFVMDASAGVLVQVPLAGTTNGGQSGGNVQYVLAAYFDGPTADPPKLEAHDDSTHATANSAFLGGGTPADSTLRAVATTVGPPGSATWDGTPLAGTTSRIALASAALTTAANLYFNVKQVLASTFSAATGANEVFTLRYLYA